VSAELTHHEVGLEGLDALTGLEALCVFVGEDERPLVGTAGFVDWRLCGRLSRLLQEGFFTGSPEDTLLVPTQGALAIPRLFAIGLGRREGLSRERLEKALGLAGRTLKKAGIRTVALELPALEGLGEAGGVELLRQAFLPVFAGSRVAVFAGRAPSRASEGRTAAR
jgi:hypothetical protein